MTDYERFARHMAQLDKEAFAQLWNPHLQAVAEMPASGLRPMPLNVDYFCGVRITRVLLP